MEALWPPEGAGRGTGGTHSPGGKQLEHVGGKVDRGGLLCHPTGRKGDRGEGVSRGLAHHPLVGMPARVNTYVKDAFAVVNTGGEEAVLSPGAA